MSADEPDEQPTGPECECGFVFSGPGQYRNSEAFVTDAGAGGVVCPKCNTHYLCSGQGLIKITLKEG